MMFLLFLTAGDKSMYNVLISHNLSQISKISPNLAAQGVVGLKSTVNALIGSGVKTNLENYSFL